MTHRLGVTCSPLLLFCCNRFNSHAVRRFANKGKWFFLDAKKNAFFLSSDKLKLRAAQKLFGVCFKKVCDCSKGQGDRKNTVKMIALKAIFLVQNRD
jgi:hypothetical protein